MRPDQVRAFRKHSLVDTRELIGLTVLLGAYGVVFASDMQPEYLQFMNIVGPAFLAAVLAGGCWWQLAQDQRSLWQPLVWFRLGCIAYYGVGSLAPYIANDATVQFMQLLYAFSDEEALKVGLINVSCILIVLLSVWVVLWDHRAGSWAIAQRRLEVSQSKTLLFAAIFLIVGGVTRYLFVLPSSLGLIETLPGVVITVAKSYGVGLFLIVLASFRGSHIALPISLALVPIDLVVGLLTFAKTEVLTTLIFAYLGLLHHKLNLSRILVGASIVLAVFSQLDPPIHFGRDELWRRHGKLEAPLEERLEILISYFSGASDSGPMHETQTALSRLSYVNAAAMVVSWHDVGMTGDSLGYALTVMVPRFIWPNKPEITAIGADLYTAATAQTGSSISPGLFAEAYWNFGWLGVPFLMIPLGIILGLFSQYSLYIGETENWLHLPVVFLGVQIGTRVDGTYVADVIGASGIALVCALMLFIIEITLSRRQPH
jgi:hypothetical protein